MALQDLLASLPVVGGMAASRAQRESTQSNQLQQATGVMSLAGLLREQQAKQVAAQREAAFRGELQALGPDATPDQRIAVATKYDTPQNIVTTQQKSLDLKESAAQRAQLAKDAATERRDRAREMIDFRYDQMGQTAQNEDQKRQLEERRIADKAENDRRHDLTLRAIQGATQGQREQALEIQRQRVQQQGDNQTNNMIGTFTNHLQHNKIPGVVASVTTANDLLRKYENGDIPGFGLLTGSKMMPSALRSEEANNVRSTVQAVTNDLLNMYSGLAVTLPEGDRRDLEQMQGGQFTSQDFKNAWPRVVNRANAVVGNLKAGLPPTALQAYQSRPGAMNLEPIKPAFGAKAVMDAADAILSGGKKP